jgi:hypothetical protein
VTDLILLVKSNVNIAIDNNMTLIVHVDNLDISALGYYNNTVKVSLVKTKLELAVLTPILTKLINNMFGDGVSLGTWLTNHGLGFLDLTDMVVSDGVNYLYVQLTPTYRRNQINVALPSPNIQKIISELNAICVFGNVNLDS